jgi:MtN3 and saliva related transmembrane protein
MNLIQIVGSVAGFMTTISFLPQAIKVYKTKDTRGISLLMYLVFVVGLSFWIIFGFLSHQLPVIIPNVITILFASYILGMKVLQMIRVKTVRKI